MLSLAPYAQRLQSVSSAERDEPQNGKHRNDVALLTFSIGSSSKPRAS